MRMPAIIKNDNKVTCGSLNFKPVPYPSIRVYEFFIATEMHFEVSQ